MKRLALMLAMLGFVYAGDQEKRTEKEKPSADAAKDFTLVDIHGKKVKLSEYKGKTIVLEWVNYGCPYVKKHYRGDGHMQKLQKKYGKQGVVWIQVCSSAKGKQGYLEPKQWQATNKKLGVSAVTLLDPLGTVGRMYDAKTTPQMVVIDKEFNRVYEGAIDDTRAPRADPVRCKNYVAQVLDAVVAGKKSPIRRTKSYGCSVKYAPKPDLQ